jgi:hypothetical protein
MAKAEVLSPVRQDGLPQKRGISMPRHAEFLGRNRSHLLGLGSERPEEGGAGGDMGLSGEVASAIVGDGRP